MRIWNILKIMMGCIVAISIIFATTENAYCTEYWFDDRTFEEYIQKSNQEWEEQGYSTSTTLDNSWNGSSGTEESKTDKTEKSTEANSSNKVMSCDHSYSSKVTKNATCLDLGEVTYTCSKCGASYTEPIPATGKHDYIAEVTKEATCTEKGETTYTCSVCGDSYTEEIPETEHKYGRVVAEDATCTTDGTFVYICEVCDDSYTEAIPASGHKEGTPVIVNEAGLFSQGETQVACEYCGEVLSSEVIPSILPAWILIIPVVIIVSICILLVYRRRSVKK